MGITNIVHACSHLQNASRARLGLTSLPNYKNNLHLALALQRSGFISTVTRGGPSPPPSVAFPNQFTSDPTSSYSADQTVPTSIEDETNAPVTSANVSSRRLWLGLKYWNNEPVMKTLKIISKPTRVVRMKVSELEMVARGFPRSSVPGLTLGQCLYVCTDRGVLEVREAIEKRVGGVVWCLVSN